MRRPLPFTLIFVLVVTLSTILTGAFFVSAQIRLKRDLFTAQSQFLITQFSSQATLMLADHKLDQLHRYGLGFAQKANLDLLKVFNSHGEILLNVEKNREIGLVFKEEEESLHKAHGAHKLEAPMVYASHSTGKRHIFLIQRMRDYWSVLVQDEYSLELKTKPTEGLQEYGQVVMGFDQKAINQDIFTDAMVGILVVFFTVMLNLLVAFKFKEWQKD